MCLLDNATERCKKLRNGGYTFGSYFISVLRDIETLILQKSLEIKAVTLNRRGNEI